MTWHPLHFAATHGIPMCVCKGRGASKKKDWRWKQHSSFLPKVLCCGMWRHSAINSTASSNCPSLKTPVSGPSHRNSITAKSRVINWLIEGKNCSINSDCPQLCTDVKCCSLSIIQIAHRCAQTSFVIIRLSCSACCLASRSSISSPPAYNLLTIFIDALACLEEAFDNDSPTHWLTHWLINGFSNHLIW